MAGLKALQARYPSLMVDVRGTGLMLGAELTGVDAEVQRHLQIKCWRR